jgi:hypothetical protein
VSCQTLPVGNGLGELEFSNGFFFECNERMEMRRIVRLGMTLALFALSAAAAANHMCTNSPNEVFVGMTQASNGVASVPLCRWVTPSESPAQAPPLAPLQPTFGAIANHPDFDGVWFSGPVRGSFETAEGVVKQICQRDTADSRTDGSGCWYSWGFSNGVTAVVRAHDGTYYFDVGPSHTIAAHKAQRKCAGHPHQILACEEVFEFSASTATSDSVAFARGAAFGSRAGGRGVQRKLFLASAWVTGALADNRMWVVTGSASQRQADEAAVAACRSSVPSAGASCVSRSSSGSTYLQAFIGEQEGKVVVQGSRSETTPSRLSAAIRKHCQGKNWTCTEQTIFNASARGTFIHNFTTGKTDQLQ